MGHLGAGCRRAVIPRFFCSGGKKGYPCHEFVFPRPAIDYKFLLDPANRERLVANAAARKGCLLYTSDAADE